MKAEIHPNYVQTTVTCACGAVYKVGSTRRELKIGICAACHPFFTGEQKFVDTAGRVEKFARRFGSTKATRVDGGWRISGQKIWTTAAQFSQWGALLARTDSSAPKHNGITYFLLDMKSEGVTVKPLRELTGQEFFNSVISNANNASAAACRTTR